VQISIFSVSTSIPSRPRCCLDVVRNASSFLQVLRNHGKGYTEKADIWSVGCTVIEMCTARRPWPEFNTNEAVM
jgi:serine/threonine protein kinase